MWVWTVVCGAGRSGDMRNDFTPGDREHHRRAEPGTVPDELTPGHRRADRFRRSFGHHHGAGHERVDRADVVVGTRGGKREAVGAVGVDPGRVERAIFGGEGVRLLVLVGPGDRRADRDGQRGGVELEVADSTPLSRLAVPVSRRSSPMPKRAATACRTCRAWPGRTCPVSCPTER